VYTLHFALATALMFLPVHDIVLVIILVCMNFFAMTRRIVRIQRGSEQIKSWSVISQWGLKATQIAMEILGMSMLGVSVILFFLRGHSAHF
jgi:uncharacterized membrane protein YqiK